MTPQVCGSRSSALQRGGSALAGATAGADSRLSARIIARSCAVIRGWVSGEPEIYRQPRTQMKPSNPGMIKAGRQPYCW